MTQGRKNIRSSAADATFSGLEFVAGIAHDLKTPLAAIAASAELLQQELDAGTSTHLIKVIQRQAERLNLMVGELSDGLRTGPKDVVLRAKLLDLSSLVRDTAEDFGRIEAAHRLVIDVPSTSVLMLGDYDKVRRILENLLKNAFLYSPVGTTVNVELTSAGGGALIAVQDEGPGVPENMRSRIFDAFVRILDRTQHGQGLGLHVVRILVEAHAGRVWMEPAPERGSRFLVWLPTAPTEVD